MVKDLFTEKLDYVKTRFNTKLGLFDFFIASFFWGIFLVNYTPRVFDLLTSIVPLSGMFQQYIAYLLFGLILTPIGLGVTFIITILYNILFNKNGRIIK